MEEKTAGVLWFAKRTEMDFAEKALRTLGNDHFDSMGYIFR